MNVFLKLASYFFAIIDYIAKKNPQKRHKDPTLYELWLTGKRNRLYIVEPLQEVKPFLFKPCPKRQRILSQISGWKIPLEPEANTHKDNE